MNKRTRMVGTGVLALALAGGGAGTAAALAGSGTAAASSTTSSLVVHDDSAVAASAADAALGRRERRELRAQLRQLVRHSEHAEFLVDTPKKGEITVDIDKGKLTNVSSTTIEITRRDGTTVSATITGSTHFFGLPESKLGSGDRVLLVQSGGDAVDVASLPPKPSSSATA